MDIMSLDRLAQEIGGHLPLIKGMGGSLVEPIGFVLMNVNPSFTFYIYIYVTFIFQPEGSFKVHLQFVHSSVLRVYIYV